MNDLINICRTWPVSVLVSLSLVLALICSGIAQWMQKRKGKLLPVHELIPNFDYAAFVRGDAAWLSVSRLIDHIDLLNDEMQRIKNLAEQRPDDMTAMEIVGLCRRSMKVIKQRVPVIQQRDDAEKQANKNERLLMEATDRLAILEGQKKMSMVEVARLTGMYTEALRVLDNHRAGLVPKLVTTGVPSTTQS